MTTQGAVKIVAALVDRGYVDLTEARDDARHKPLTLTARGRSAIAASEAIQARIERRWAAAVGDADMQAMRAGLLAACSAAGRPVAELVQLVWGLLAIMDVVGKGV